MLQCQTSSDPLTRLDVADHGRTEAYLGGFADESIMHNRGTRSDPRIRANPYVPVHNRSMTDKDPIAQDTVVRNEGAVSHTTARTKSRALAEQPPRDHRIGENVASGADLSRSCVHQFDRMAVPVAGLKAR